VGVTGARPAHLVRHGAGVPGLVFGAGEQVVDGHEHVANVAGAEDALGAEPRVSAVEGMGKWNTEFQAGLHPPYRSAWVPCVGMRGSPPEMEATAYTRIREKRVTFFRSFADIRFSSSTRYAMPFNLWLPLEEEVVWRRAKGL
jgi:hypothetical protein